MYERTMTRAMQGLLDLLNGDFVSVKGLPAIVKGESERAEAERLQHWLVQYLTPILFTRAEHVVEQQGAKWAPLLHKAKRRGWSGAREGIRRWLARPPEEIKATLQCDREQGFYVLVSELNEWARTEKIRPQWQVIDNQIPELRSDSKVPDKRRYMGGSKVVTVSQNLFRRPTLKNLMMQNVGECLVNGEITRLRVCAESTCRRYFYAEDFRDMYCAHACYKIHDKAAAPGRMQRFREKQRTADAALKRYALATLPKLDIRTLRALAKKHVLSEREINVLEGLHQRLGEGTPHDRIWERSAPRTRALFKKLREASVL